MIKKIELHLHLDGSIREETANEILGKKCNLKAKDKCEDLNEYLEKFEIPSIILQTKENLERCLSEINIESLLATQNLDYSQVVDNYVNDTNMSKDDVEKILESSEYSSLVGNYVMDSDMIDLSQYFDGTDIVGDEESVEDTLSSIDKTMKSEDIKDVFEKLGVNYTESDINYFKNSLTAEVAPKVQTQIDEVLNQNSQDLKKINIDGIKKIFTQKTVTTNKIIIVVCALLILLLNYKNVSFLTVYAINSFVVLVGLELFDFIIKKVDISIHSINCNLSTFIII